MAALTKQEILKEIVKAGKDPVYFTTSYCRISHPQKGLIPFKAFDYQQDLLKDFRDYRFNIILKPDSWAFLLLVLPTLRG